MIVLLGLLVLVAGFALRFHPLLVVVAAALTTGLAAGLGLAGTLAAFGKAFNDNRYVSVAYMVLPVIGLLERHGLQARARSLVAALRRATAGRLLIGYMLLRQGSAALGLISIGGQVQTVRPLVAPMVDGAARAQSGVDARDEQAAAMAAATDNVAVMFGEDIFVAMGSILLIKGVLEGYGVIVAPLHLSLWSIPTAIAALAIHGARLWWLDRRLAEKRRGGEPQA